MINMVWQFQRSPISQNKKLVEHFFVQTWFLGFLNEKWNAFFHPMCFRGVKIFSLNETQKISAPRISLLWQKKNQIWWHIIKKQAIYLNTPYDKVGLVYKIVKFRMPIVWKLVVGSGEQGIENNLPWNNFCALVFGSM